MSFDTLPKAKSFTLIVIDVDDTIIPTSIRSAIKDLFEIDIFHLLSEHSIKRLQSSVTKAIQQILELIVKNSDDPNHNVRVALVSNASQQWLNYVFDPLNGKFDILAKYFAEQKVPIKSAQEETSKYVQKKFASNSKYQDPKSQSDVFENLRWNPWMWKYTTISVLIQSIKKELKCKCTQIISFGDGIDEKMAIEQLKTHANRVHFGFVRNPTVYQLRKQWQFVCGNFEKLMAKVNAQTKQENCYVFDLKDVFANDNNELFCGSSEQIPSIALYFRCWLDSLNHGNTAIAEYKDARIRYVVNRIHGKLARAKDKKSNAYIAFKQIVLRSLCCHQEFYDVLSDYCDFVYETKKT